MNLAGKFSYFLGSLLVLSFSLWLVVQINENDLLNFQQSDETLPDAYASHVIVIQMNEQGYPKSRFYADEVKHYINGITTLTAPYGILYEDVSKPIDVGGVLTVNEKRAKQSRAPKPPWTVKADQGELRDNGNILYLWGHVKIHQDKGNNNQETLFTTTSLTYYPKTHLAQTKEPVEITQSDGSKVNAVGMDADFNRSEVNFLSHVRTRYEIQP